MSTAQVRDDVEPLPSAGEQYARDLLRAVPTELREEIPPDLRAVEPYAPGRLRGCPCGCGDTELLERVREGDDVALSALLQRYRVLARSKAKSYFLLGADRDDVLQEAMIGLYKAIRDYDERRGASFRTFAELCVTRQVVSAVKAATRLKHGPLSNSTSLDSPAGDEDGATLAELIPSVTSLDPAAVVISADEMSALQRHLDEVLSDLELQILRHHLDGKSYVEIAGMLQRHVKSVDNALQRIKRKIQRHVDERTRQGA